MELLRIASRQSKLALWQAEWVKAELVKRHPSLEIKIIGITTEGDRRLDVSLSKIGGKGLFVKELENALLENRADIAVHSLKDMPTEQPPGLTLTAYCQRHDPRDVLLAKTPQLKDDALIGTSSFRRQLQIKAIMPHCRVNVLRGNVDTRIRKMLEGEYDGIILAAAGIERLGLTQHAIRYFTTHEFIPTAGQGALAIECRRDDKTCLDLLSPLNHADTLTCITAERAVVKTLGGDCKTPIGAYAEIAGDALTLRALAGLPDASVILKTAVTGHRDDAYRLGKLAAEQLLKDGAQDIIEKCRVFAALP